MQEEKKKRRNIVFSNVAGVSENFRRIFPKDDILVQFRLCNTLIQKLIHSKEKSPRNKLNNVYMQLSAVRSAVETFILGRPNNLSTNEWLITGEPAHLARTQQSTST